MEHLRAFARVPERDCPVVTPGAVVADDGDRRPAPLFARRLSLIVVGLDWMSAVPRCELIPVVVLPLLRPPVVVLVPVADAGPPLDDPPAPPDCAVAGDATSKPISKTGIACLITDSPCWSAKRIRHKPNPSIVSVPTLQRFPFKQRSLEALKAR